MHEPLDVNALADEVANGKPAGKFASTAG